MPGRAESPWLGRRIGGVALDGRAVGVLNGAEPGGDPGLAGGDGLAVAPAVQLLGEALAELLDFADVGLALVGVGGDGQDGRWRSVASRTRLTVWLLGSRSARAMIWGPSVSGQACALGAALPGSLVEVGEHQVSPVELVAGGAEVLADGPRLVGCAAGSSAPG